MSDDDYPEYSEDAELGDRGRRIVEDLVRDELRWIFREIRKEDLGIDGYVEIVRDDRKSKGRLFAVQIKTGPSYLKEQIDDGFVYRGSLMHLNYWTGHSLPVLVVLCDPATRTCYWEHVGIPNVTRTPKAWKITVPRAKTLSSDHKAALAKLTEPPQPVDFIELALYQLLIEKYPSMVIAQELETPNDFWGFSYMAHLDGELVLITYVFKPEGAAFSTTDIDEVLRKRNICAGACGWDRYPPIPRVLLFLVAEKPAQLELSDEFTAYLATKPEISRYRVHCSFSYGISLRELDDNDGWIDLYDRDLPQMRSRKPEGKSPAI